MGIKMFLRIKNYFWLKKHRPTLDQKISWHQDQSSRGCDMYCSSHDSTPRTRKGFKLMVRHTNKVIKLQRYKLRMNVESFHHSLVVQINDMVGDLHNDNKRFKVWKLLKSLEED